MTIRLATDDDAAVLIPLINAAIEELQKGFLDDEQIEASKAIMGIDRQLIADRTYFVVDIDGAVAGCGGWSRRATLYGGDHSAGRDAALLEPATDPARVRAMYTHPDYARRGIGRRVLEACQAAAAAEGFATLELMATRSGRPLYEAFGFQPVEEVEDASGGTPVPLTRMRKPVAAAAPTPPPVMVEPSDTWHIELTAPTHGTYPAGVRRAPNNTTKQFGTDRPDLNDVVRRPVREGV